MLNKYPDDWEQFELDEIIEISSKKFNPKKEKEIRKCIELEHLSKVTGEILGYTNSNLQQSTKHVFKKNQVLFGKLRPYLKKYWKAEFDGVCSSEIWVLNGKKIINDFLFYFVQTYRFNQVANISSGSKMPRADWKYMSNIPFTIPPEKEQKKIATILKFFDKTIIKQKELIKEKKKYLKGLIQNLLTNNEKFEKSTSKLLEFKLSELLSEIKEKTIIENQHQVLSSTIEKIELRDGRVDGKTNIGYKILRKNQLVLSPQNLWLGNINVNYNFNIGIVSPSYKIFNINEKIILSSYARYLFKTSKMVWEYKLCSEVGASIVRRSLDLDSFLLISIKLPNIVEQEKIVKVLSLVDKEIELLEQELFELEQQKKGLMQKLLTGEVRVKV